MTTTLTPSLVGQAEKTHNAVLYQALSATTLDETPWITLVLANGASGPIDREPHVARVAQTARFAARDVQEAIEELLRESLLVEEDGRLAVTSAGAATVARVRAATGPVVARAYADIPVEDLAIAARVLTEITARLAVELDGPSD